MKHRVYEGCRFFDKTGRCLAEVKLRPELVVGAPPGMIQQVIRETGGLIGAHLGRHEVWLDEDPDGDGTPIGGPPGAA